MTLYHNRVNNLQSGKAMLPYAVLGCAYCTALHFESIKGYKDLTLVQLKGLDLSHFCCK